MWTGASAFAVGSLAAATADRAQADTKVSTRYATQRMSDANLTSKQVGASNKGAIFTARCWASWSSYRGPYVR